MVCFWWSLGRNDPCSCVSPVVLKSKMVVGGKLQRSICHPSPRPSEFSWCIYQGGLSEEVPSLVEYIGCHSILPQRQSISLTTLLPLPQHHSIFTTPSCGWNTGAGIGVTVTMLQYDHNHKPQHLHPQHPPPPPHNNPPPNNGSN